MPRRSRFLARPHEALRQAAETHGKIVRGEPHPDESGDELPADDGATPQSQRASAQRRDAGGSFA